MQGPSKLGDMMPVGFGDVGGGVVDDVFAEEGYGRRCDDHGPQWVAKEGKKDGFVWTLTRIVSILPEGNHYGGTCGSCNILSQDRAPFPK